MIWGRMGIGGWQWRGEETQQKEQLNGLQSSPAAALTDTSQFVGNTCDLCWSNFSPDPWSWALLETFFFPKPIKIMREKKRYYIVGPAFPEGELLQSNSSHTNAIFNTGMRRPFSSLYHITFRFIDVQQVPLHFLAEHLILPAQTFNGDHKTSAESFGYTTTSRNFSGALTASIPAIPSESPRDSSFVCSKGHVDLKGHLCSTDIL